MGRNRKFVLEDDLQQAVWRSILRGPGVGQDDAQFEARFPKAGTVWQWEEFRGEGAEVVWSDFDDTTSFPLSRGSDGCRAQSSGEALGEGDEASATIKAALQKTEGQAQERPVSKQIKSTQLYIGRKEKRVDQARQAVIEAREALDKAVAIQQEREALLTDGVKWLTALQE